MITNIKIGDTVFLEYDNPIRKIVSKVLEIKHSPKRGTLCRLKPISQNGEMVGSNYEMSLPWYGIHELTRVTDNVDSTPIKA